MIGENFFSYVSSLPTNYQNIFHVAFYMVLIIAYAIFIGKVYRLISRKDIISLNLRRYNSFDHPTINKVFAGFLYFIEYLIVLPFLVLFWYVLFALVLIFFSEITSVQQILLISAAVVGSIRFLSYYNSEISAEVAKLLPFTILAITLLNPRLFDFAKLNNTLVESSQFISFIGYVLIFIIGLEIVLRFLDLFKRIIVDKD